MKTMMLALGLALAAGAAQAASVTNMDTEAAVLVVTENGEKSEMIVQPAETLDFCLSGCFVTFPNGDRQALTGAETIEIAGGKVLIR